MSYKPFGPEWRKEMNRMTKDELIDFIKSLGTDLRFYEANYETLRDLQESMIESRKYISPIRKERQWQEDQIKKILPDFPHGHPHWQVFNTILTMALKYMEQNQKTNGRN